LDARRGIAEAADYVLSPAMNPDENVIGLKDEDVWPTRRGEFASVSVRCEAHSDGQKRE
jgi:hypothetical protein